MPNSVGQEVPDPNPVALPLRYVAPLPLEERIRRMIREDLSEQAVRDGAESWDEANDFNVPDEDGRMPIADEFLEEDEFASNDPFLAQAADKKKAEVDKRIADVRKQNTDKAVVDKKQAEGAQAPGKAQSNSTPT